MKIRCPNCQSVNYDIGDEDGEMQDGGLLTVEMECEDCETKYEVIFHLSLEEIRLT